VSLVTYIFKKVLTYLKKWLELKIKLAIRNAKQRLNYRIRFLVQALVVTWGIFVCASSWIWLSLTDFL